MEQQIEAEQEEKTSIVRQKRELEVRLQEVKVTICLFRQQIFSCSFTIVN